MNKNLLIILLMFILAIPSASAFCFFGVGDCQDIFIPKVRNADQITYSNVLDGNTVLSEFLAETTKDGYITNNGDVGFPDVNVSHVEISITGDLNINVNGMTAFVDGNIFDVSSLDVNLSDNTKTFIYIKNDGSNTYTVSASDPRDQSVFTFALVGEAFTGQGEVLHVHAHPPIKRELSILNKNIDLAFGTIVISGLSVTVNQVSTDFNVTSGSWLLNFQDLHELSPLYSTLTNGVTWHFHSGGDVAQSKDNSGLNFSQWDNGTDLDGVNAGRWYTDFVFVLEHEMTSDSNVHIAISATEHNLQADALAEDFVVPFGFSGVAVPILKIVRRGNQTDFSNLDTFVFIDDIRNTGAGGGGGGGGDGATQNLWATIAGDTGSTTANTSSDTLTIAGGSFVTTSVIGDTLTIDSQDTSCDNNSDCTLTGNVNSVNGEFVNLTVTGITKTEADLTVFDDFNAGVSGSFPLVYKKSGAFSLFGGDASGTASIAIGVLSVSTGPYSTAIGFEAEAIGTSTIAMNNLSFATGNYAMAFGNLASADGVDTVAIGLGADASVGGGPGGCVAIGFGSVCRDLGMVTLSKDVNVAQDLIVGRNVTVTGILTTGILTDGTATLTGGALTNATGLISQWTNDSGYLTTSDSDTNYVTAGATFDSYARSLFSGVLPISYNSGTGAIGFTGHLFDKTDWDTNYLVNVWNSDFNVNWLDLLTGQDISLLTNDSGYITSFWNCDGNSDCTLTGDITGAIGYQPDTNAFTGCSVTQVLVGATGCTNTPTLTATNITGVPAASILAGIFGGSTAYTFPQSLMVTTNLGVGQTASLDARLIAGLGTEWGSNNYGASIAATGIGRNNAIAILSSAGNLPWAIANIAGGDKLTIAAMPELGDSVTNPIRIVTFDRSDKSSAFEGAITSIGTINTVAQFNIDNINVLNSTQGRLLIGQGVGISSSTEIYSGGGVLSVTFNSSNNAIFEGTISGVTGDFDQANSSAAIPVLVLDQADISEPFIEFIGSNRGVISVGSSLGSIRVKVGGVVVRLAIYSDA